MNEIEKVADSVTILRDGQTIRTLDMKRDGVTEDVIIKGMVGRDLTNRYPERTPDLGETIFEIRNWEAYHPTQADRKMLHGINLHIRRGKLSALPDLWEPDARSWR